MVQEAISSLFGWLNWRGPPPQLQEPEPESKPEAESQPEAKAQSKAESKPVKMSATKRTKPSTSLDPTIIIGELASLTGTNLITVGSDSVIQSRAKLVSTHAPVTIGSACILSEKCCVGLQSPSTNQPDGVVVGDYVIIEVNAVVEAMQVGEGCTIEVGAKLGKGSIIGKHCTIGPLCTVEENEVLPDYTVVYGTGQRRIDKSEVDEVKLEMVRQQILTLKKLLQSNIAKFQ